MNTEPTTLALPSDLLAAVDKVVQEGRARSRDELVESALRLRLAELRRAALDAEFRHMADDVDYQRDVHRILGEFAQADRETFHEEPGPDCSDLPMGANQRTPEKKTLRFDRPFALLLRDWRAGAVLFAGVVYRPGLQGREGADFQTTVPDGSI